MAALCRSYLLWPDGTGTPSIVDAAAQALPALRRAEYLGKGWLEGSREKRPNLRRRRLVCQVARGASLYTRAKWSDVGAGARFLVASEPANPLPSKVSKQSFALEVRWRSGATTA